MTEVWAPVAGHKYYEVSNLGRVRSLDRTVLMLNRWGKKTLRRLRGKLLKPQPFPNGYHFVFLGRGTSHLVHRLVARAFVPGYRRNLQVNHRDGVRSHNAATNLSWVTCSENHQHSYAELNRKPHAWTRGVRVGVQSFASVNEAARHLNVTSGSVSSAARHQHRCKGQEVSYV